MKKTDNKITIKKMWGHIKVVHKHRMKVFKLCCKVGIPVQGLFHDISKYSPTEFFESVKYFQGDYSPIVNCKKEHGYSEAWLHHKGRNKHHYEYWFDYNAKTTTPPIPFKYFLELVCDSFAAGMVYQGKNWTQEYQLYYWTHKKDKAYMDEGIKKLLERVYTEVADNGLDKVLNKKYLKKLYYEYVKEK